MPARYTNLAVSSSTIAGTSGTVTLSATSITFNYKITATSATDSSVTDFLIKNTGASVGGFITVVTTINVVTGCSVTDNVILNNETITCSWTPDSITPGRYTSFAVSSSITGTAGNVILSAASLTFNYKITATSYTDSSVTDFQITNTGASVGGVIAVVTTINVVTGCSVTNVVTLNNETITCSWTPDSIMPVRYTNLAVSSSTIGGTAGAITLSATSLTFNYKITVTSATDSSVTDFVITNTVEVIAVVTTIKVVTGCSVPNTVILNNETITCSWTPDSIMPARYTNLAVSSSTIAGTSGTVTLSATSITFSYKISATASSGTSVIDFLIKNLGASLGGFITVVTTINVVTGCSLSPSVFLNNQLVSCSWANAPLTILSYTSLSISSSSFPGTSGLISLSSSSFTFHYQITATSTIASSVSDFLFINSITVGGQISLASATVITGCTLSPVIILNNETVSCSWTSGTLILSTISSLSGLTSTSTTSGALSHFSIDSSGVFLSFNYSLTTPSLSTTSILFRISDSSTSAVVAPTNSNIVVSECILSPVIIINNETVTCSWISGVLTSSTISALANLTVSSTITGTKSNFAINSSGLSLSFNYQITTTSSSVTSVSFTITDSTTYATLNILNSNTVVTQCALNPTIILNNKTVTCTWTGALLSSTITAINSLTATSTTAGTTSNFTIDSSGLFVTFNYQISTTSTSATSVSYMFSDSVTFATLISSSSNTIISQCTLTPAIVLNNETVTCTWTGGSLISSTLTALAGLTVSSVTTGTLSNFTLNSGGTFITFNYQISNTSIAATSVSYSISDTNTRAIITASSTIISQCTVSPASSPKQ